MTGTNISQQTAFFNAIKQIISPNITMVNEISEIIEVSTDGAYRRIRGETSLTLDEAIKLCRHFKLSFDMFNSSTAGSVTFAYSPMGRDVVGFEKYFADILRDLKNMETFSNRNIVFAAVDIPLFHYFKFPTLTAFKIFYWQKAIISIPELEHKKFDKAEIPQKLIDCAAEILKTYCNIPSTEIWTEDTILSAIKQIEFFWDAGFFMNKEDALVVVEELSLMTKGILRQAQLTKKFIHENKADASEGDFCMYQSDVMVASNTIFATIGDGKATYLSFNTFNAMITTNAAFCAETDLWIKNLMKKSNLISGIGEKHRNIFFGRLEQHTDRLRKKISS